MSYVRCSQGGRKEPREKPVNSRLESRDIDAYAMGVARMAKPRRGKKIKMLVAQSCPTLFDPVD